VQLLTSIFGEIPAPSHESLDLATRLEAACKALGGRAGDSLTVRSGATVLGEVTALPVPEGFDNWTGAIFAQSPLMQIHWALDKHSELKQPGDSRVDRLPLCRLDKIGTLGYDARDIFDAFGVDKTAAEWSPYPGFWDHDAKRVVCISQKPNATLLARGKPLPGRKLKDATAVWSKAGTILIVSRLRTNTHRVIATGFSDKVLGNTWWGFEDSKLTADQKKALLLWLNGSLSILLYFGRRAITEGAWMQMKKPAWASMPVLDVTALDAGALHALAKAYDLLATQDLSPIAQLNTDLVRRQIDDAICNVLGLPNLTPMRDLLAREPGLSARDIAPRERVEDNESEIDEIQEMEVKTPPVPKKRSKRLAK